MSSTQAFPQYIYTLETCSGRLQLHNCSLRHLSTAASCDLSLAELHKRPLESRPCKNSTWGSWRNEPLLNLVSHQWVVDAGSFMAKFCKRKMFSFGNFSIFELFTFLWSLYVLTSPYKNPPKDQMFCHRQPTEQPFSQETKSQLLLVAKYSSFSVKWLLLISQPL